MPAVRAAGIRALLGASRRSVSTRRPGTPSAPTAGLCPCTTAPGASALHPLPKPHFLAPLCMLRFWLPQVLFVRGKKHRLPLYRCHLDHWLLGEPTCEVMASGRGSSARGHWASDLSEFRAYPQSLNFYNLFFILQGISPRVSHFKEGQKVKS